MAQEKYESQLVTSKVLAKKHFVMIMCSSSLVHALYETDPVGSYYTS